MRWRRARGARRAWRPRASGGGGGQVVAGPGAVATTYATPVVTIQQGQSLTFTNLDVAQHDVVSTTHGLFDSPLIGIGRVAPASAASRRSHPGNYGFYCSPPPNMTGTLTVQ